MSREDIREHAANIMDRMKSSAQPLPSTKVIMHGLSLMVPREVMFRFTICYANMLTQPMAKGMLQ